MENLEELLNSADVNGAILDMCTYVNQLCDHGTRLDLLTGPQRVFFHNQWLELEVNNGGFDQFFLNSTGDHAHETVSSLRAIGANATADIVQKAIDQFPNSIVPLYPERAQVLSEIEEKANPVWSECDDKFYEYTEDLNALNMAYIRSHRDQF